MAIPEQPATMTINDQLLSMRATALDIRGTIGSISESLFGPRPTAAENAKSSSASTVELASEISVILSQVRDELARTYTNVAESKTQAVTPPADYYGARTSR